MLFIVAVMSFSAITHAEIYTGEGSYIMSEGENLGVAKERAKADAIRNASEKAGVYVKNYTRTKNLMLEKDIIETLTANILKLVEAPIFLPYEQLDNLEGLLIRVVVKVQINDSDINRWLNKNEQEKSSLVSQNEYLRKANAEQELQIAELKRQLSNAKTKADKETITKKFVDADQKFLSYQKLDEAQRLYDKGDYESVIEICTEAIEFNPYNPFLYGLRGLAYLNLKQYERSDADSDKFKELLPYLKAEIYKERGDNYAQSGQCELAIQNYNKAIEINPNDAEFYRDRGIAYVNFAVHYITNKDSERAFANYKLAIQDFNKAIKINPNDAVTWGALGTACSALGQDERAIIDFNRALKLDPKNAEVYFKRGMTYNLMGNFESAISDYTKAIELNPNEGTYRIFRGILYQKIGEYVKAQVDFAKAKQLGFNG
ncbi:MAG: tetratricopeptide repeat protein [Quinella sp. 1Q7]|nr:tetratricopeptide repeat protein [Quinella sp. 1Q7]